MAGQFNETISIGSKADTRGFKKAETAAAKLTKQVKSLATALGVGLGTAAIVSFGKASVKAFAEDEKAALSLARTVKNLGLEFGNQGKLVNDYISNLEQQTGVLDDELRPALDRLLRSTLSIAKAQELLNLALDIAAGTGRSVTQVSQSLQKAYLGQTQALGRLGVGLSKAELTSSSFEKIQERLTYLFAGQAKDAANSYAGQIARLDIAANNAKETIGKGLVDALILATGKDKDVQDLADSMASLAEYTADTVRGLGVLASKLQSIDKVGTGGLLGKLLSANFKYGLLGQLAELGNDSQPRSRAGRSFMGGSGGSTSADLIEKKRQADLKKLTDTQVKATKALTAEQKKQAALKKAGSIFDLEQVQLIAALKGKLSDEDRKRVELQFALITGNTAEATKLTAEIAKAQGLGKDLAGYLASLPDAKNPFTAWSSYLDMLAKKAALVASATGATPSGTDFMSSVINQSAGSVPATNVAVGAFPRSQPGNFRAAEEASNRTGPIQVVVQIDGKAVASSLQNSSLSGIGSFVDRVSGG
jgi:hypothetical protein